MKLTERVQFERFLFEFSWEQYDDNQVTWVDFKIGEESCTDTYEPLAEGFTKWDGCTQWRWNPASEETEWMHYDGPECIWSMMKAVCECIHLAQQKMTMRLESDNWRLP